MRPFLIVWIGQLVSALGSAMTSFGVGLWLYTEGGSVTAFALNNVAFLVPWALLSPVAGAWADRYNRKAIMLIADTVQAVATLFIAILVFSEGLQIWQVYLAVAISSAARAFQLPAWSASIVHLVPKAQLGRASGMGRLSEAISRLLAPIIAGALLLAIGLGWILVIDIATFLFAVLALLVVAIPMPAKSPEEQEQTEGSTWEEVKFGMRYLWKRPGLFNLALIASLRNLFQNFATNLTLPLALMMTNVAVVGQLQALVMSGLLIGSLIMSAWGGPNKGRVRLYLSVMIAHGLTIVLAGWQQSLTFLVTGTFLMLFTVAILATLNGPVYQTKVAPAVQGRVFATITFVAVILEPIGHAVVGPVTDFIMEPAMMAGGWLEPILGPLIGVGEGRGMGAVFLIMGLLTAGLGVYGWLHPRVRNLETELPDQVPDHPEPVVKETAPAAA